MRWLLPWAVVPPEPGPAEVPLRPQPSLGLPAAEVSAGQPALREQGLELAQGAEASTAKRALQSLHVSVWMGTLLLTSGRLKECDFY